MINKVIIEYSSMSKKFHVSIEDLHISAKGDSLEEAIKNFDKKFFGTKMEEEECI